MAASGFCLVVFLLLYGAGVIAGQDLPIFDSHSHFKAEDASHFNAADIVAILERENIESMVIVGEPAERAQALYQYAADRFVPFLGLYTDYAEKATWMFDTQLPDRLARLLDKGYYAGIGEVHLFAPQRNNPVFRQIVQLASEKGLPLLLHADAEVVEQAFAWAPQLTIIWAHLGTRPEPDFIEQMLERYPHGLYIDTSVRDERFTEAGKLRPKWRSLFIRHADRLLVGIDTYSLQRWQRIDTVTQRIRHWLSMLPDDVARKLAYENARRLFAGTQGGNRSGAK